MPRSRQRFRHALLALLLYLGGFAHALSAALLWKPSPDYDATTDDDGKTSPAAQQLASIGVVLLVWGCDTVLYADECRQVRLLAAQRRDSVRLARMNVERAYDGNEEGINVEGGGAQEVPRGVEGGGWHGLEYMFASALATVTCLAALMYLAASPPVRKLL